MTSLTLDTLLIFKQNPQIGRRVKVSLEGSSESMYEYIWRYFLHPLKVANPPSLLEICCCQRLKYSIYGQAMGWEVKIRLIAWYKEVVITLFLIRVLRLYHQNHILSSSIHLFSKYTLRPRSGKRHAKLKSIYITFSFFF